MAEVSFCYAPVVFIRDDAGDVAGCGCAVAGVRCRGELGCGALAGMLQRKRPALSNPIDVLLSIGL